MNEVNQKIIDLINMLTATDLSMYEQVFFEQSIQNRIQATNSLSYTGYYELLEKNVEERHVFLSSFQINYSEFFRNELSFSVLDKVILPEIILNFNGNYNNEIRVWCAACADGQEAYSIAMLIEEHLKNKPFKYRIFATDQSETCINTAQKGIYHTSKMGQLSLNKMNKWFEKNEEVYVVKKDLKKSIVFSVFDLFNKQYSSPPESIFGNFDIVICANLLFYYKPEFRYLILKKTTDTITKNGFFVTSEIEREMLLAFKYKEVIQKSAIFQKK